MSAHTGKRPATLTAHPAALDLTGGPRAARLRARVHDGLLSAHARAVRWADAQDAQGALPGASAQAYAALKAAVLGAGTPVGLPAVAAVAARNTARTRDVIADYPRLVDEIRHRRVPSTTAGRVLRAPSADRYVITSDLHRGPRGLADLAGVQGTAGLYAALLDHYADEGWTLIENGDVEDYWMVSGSAYAAAYDVFRMAAAAATSLVGRAPLDAVYRAHLERIVERHAPIYERLRDRFHAHGRYLRTAGNHDDVYNHPGPCAALAEVLPGLEIADFVALDPPSGPSVGIVTHGHHTDAWNAPHADRLGKVSSSAGSVLYDLPLLGLRPGIATQADSDRLLGGGAASRLMALNAVVGANLQLYSVDEARLHDACRAAWEPAGRDDGEAFGPYLVLGHTHVPLADPLAPDGVRSWRRYLNSGSGAFPGVVTAVEWDGSADPTDPVVRLVAWRWDPRRPGTPERLALARPAGEEVLVVEPLAPVPR